jgi:hypothetical protein
MGLLVLVFLWTFFVVQSDFALAESECPTNAHVDRVEVTDDVRTTHCKCDDGYQHVGGGCARVTTIRPASPTIMRAQTREECVRAAGEQLRNDLAKCKSPLIDCLTSAGVTPGKAVCAATALLVALDPSKATVMGALITCGDKLYESSDVCGPTWGKCQASSLSAQVKAVATCTKN